MLNTKLAQYLHAIAARNGIIITDAEVDGAPEKPSLRTLGTGHNQAAAGDDPRFGLATAVSVNPDVAKVPLSDGTGHILPGWLESGIITVDNVTTLQGLLAPSRFQHFTYRTLGYNSAFDGGTAEYEWRASSTSTHDSILVIKPDSVGGGSPGRWHYIVKNDTFEARSANFDFNGNTPNGLYMKSVVDLCQSYNIKRVKFPVCKIDIRDNVQWKGVANIHLDGSGIGKTIFKTYTTYVTTKANVRLTNVAAMPAYTSAGSGVGKTLTATVNGALSVDGVTPSVNDRILLKNLASALDNGIYKVTQVGNGGAPWILTRATDADTANKLPQRCGVYVTDGLTMSGGVYLGKFRTYVLSAGANRYWTSAPTITPDAQAQYWDEEVFISGGLDIASEGECSFATANAQEPLCPTKWTYNHKAGDTVLPNVGYVNGGSYFRVSEGINYTFSALAPGDDLLLRIGGTPTDQGWYFNQLFCKIVSIDASGNVTIDRPIQQQAPVIKGPAGINDYSLGVGMVPPYNENVVRHQQDNEYVKIKKLCENVEVSNITFDGATVSAFMCVKPHFHDIEIKNVHVGINTFGCHDLRFERIYGQNINGYNIGYDTGAFAWYGWWLQTNSNINACFDKIRVNGLSTDFLDNEAEGENYFKDCSIVLQPPTVLKYSINIAGTTPNVTRRSPIVNLNVKGVTSVPCLVGEPVTDMIWEVTDFNTNRAAGFASETSYLSGHLTYKGRRYSMSERRPWSVRVEMTPGMNIDIARPYDGLWASTRIKVTNHQGLTRFAITPQSVITDIDLVGLITSKPINTWLLGGFDSMSDVYPNGSDDNHQRINVTTDGTVVAGSAILIAGEIIIEQNRGDGLSGVNATTHADRVIPFTDISFADEIQGSGPPGSAPNFIGQRYYDYTNKVLYKALNRAAAASDWIRISIPVTSVYAAPTTGRVGINFTSDPNQEFFVNGLPGASYDGALAVAQPLVLSHNRTFKLSGSGSISGISYRLSGVSANIQAGTKITLILPDNNVTLVHNGTAGTNAVALKLADGLDWTPDTAGGSIELVFTGTSGRWEQVGSAISYN